VLNLSWIARLATRSFVNRSLGRGMSCINLQGSENAMSGVSWLKRVIIIVKAYSSTAWNFLSTQHHTCDGFRFSALVP
jgi:hypothetical protein